MPPENRICFIHVCTWMIFSLLIDESFVFALKKMNGTWLIKQKLDIINPMREENNPTFILFTRCKQNIRTVYIVDHQQCHYVRKARTCALSHWLSDREEKTTEIECSKNMMWNRLHVQTDTSMGRSVISCSSFLVLNSTRPHNTYQAHACSCGYQLRMVFR